MAYVDINPLLLTMLNAEPSGEADVAELVRRMSPELRQRRYQTFWDVEIRKLEGKL